MEQLSSWHPCHEVGFRWVVMTCKCWLGGKALLFSILSCPWPAANIIVRSQCATS